MMEIFKPVFVFIFGLFLVKGQTPMYTLYNHPLKVNATYWANYFESEPQICMHHFNEFVGYQECFKGVWIRYEQEDFRVFYDASAAKEECWGESAFPFKSFRLIGDPLNFSRPVLTLFPEIDFQGQPEVIDQDAFEIPANFQSLILNGETNIQINIKDGANFCLQALDYNTIATLSQNVEEDLGIMPGSVLSITFGC